MKRLLFFNAVVVAVLAMLAAILLSVAVMLSVYYQHVEVAAELPRLWANTGMLLLTLLVATPALPALRYRWRLWPLWQAVQMLALLMSGGWLVPRLLT